MAFEQERREALYLLQAIENGMLKTADIAHLIDRSDPALVHLVVSWIRNRYAGDHPAAEGVVGRLVELTNKHSSMKTKMSEGKRDPVVAWFEETHDYRDFGSIEFIAVIVEKLEG